ncbi:MAG: LCP family protein [Candidatus Melainabacteria bacterium]|nr:LCP family protein [Candidatus Melainabacteria bacterium]
MSDRYPESPNALQILGATLFGVLVGLSIIHFTKRPIFPYIPGAHPAATIVVEDSTPRAGISFPQMPKLSLLPTLDSSMNILCMGVDSNGRHTQRFLNTRSDTMMLVHVDPDTKRVGIVSIPRDSRVKLPGAHGIEKINSAHALGGPELAVEAVKEAFAVPIDHYVVVDTEGLKKVFEALGPMEIMVEKRMRYRDRAAGLHVDLEPGLQTLNPKQVEEYVRFRHDPKGDIGRIERQQWFMRQVSKKLKEPQVLLKLPEIFKFATDYVVTDMNTEEMAKVAGFGKDIQPSQVQTAMLPGHAEFIHGGSYWIPDPEACSVVFSRMLNEKISVAEQEEKTQTYGSDAATAATTYSDETDRPVRITIKYPKGQEREARQLETALNGLGYRVRYIMRGDMADCQHEQIVQMSYRADNALTERLKEKLPQITTWPVNVMVEPHASIDLTLVLAPCTKLSLSEKTEAEASDSPSTTVKTKAAL